MALTVSNQAILYRGPRTLIVCDVTFDSSYAAGGEAILATDVGLLTIDAVIATAEAGYSVAYAKTNAGGGTLKLWAAQTPDTNSALAAPIESSTGRNVSAIGATLVIIGT